ncbi:hypothetical protein EON77_11385 [bacterium]|nr:MAG: hypothetical protein EON77_11385 [bacterium]
MPTLPLPRTQHCLVCGRDNPHGLRLRLHVDDQTGVVSTSLAIAPHHGGFNDVAHGGLIATVADEAMAWASAWSAKRFGLCGELVCRFRRPARVGMTIRVEASPEIVRPRLVTTTFRCIDDHGHELATGSAKYVPMNGEHHDVIVGTFLHEPETIATAKQFVSPVRTTAGEP